MIVKPHCLCGCGHQTGGGNYRPGHDAKHVSWQFAQVKYGNLTPEQALRELPSPALHNKLVNKLWREGWTYDEWRSPQWQAPEA